MKGSFLTFMGMIVLMMTGCTSKNTTVGDIVADNITNAVSQYSLMTDQIEKSGHILNPRTLDKMVRWFMSLMMIGQVDFSQVVCGICIN